MRRAVGASRGAIFRQCVTETLLIGLLGGVFGLILTAGGLAGLRALLAAANQHAVSQLTSLNADMVVTTLVVAVLVTVCAGLYPTWRASRVQPALAAEDPVGL